MNLQKNQRQRRNGNSLVIILIVDDERTAVMNLERILTRVAPDEQILKTDDADEALRLCSKHHPDVVFMDINMPEKDGLTLAKEMKEIQPFVNIIMATAYPEYALDAYRLYVSDYLVKPVISEDVRRSLDNMRHPVRNRSKGLYVQCFGNFEVFLDGKPVSFGRAKIKEMLAYLIDRKGASATNAAIRAALWSDSVDNSQKQMHYFAQLTYELRSKLSELGAGDIFVHSRDSYAIIPEKINCDYYNALKNDPNHLSGYEGEYMSQYDWAQIRLPDFE